MWWWDFWEKFKTNFQNVECLRCQSLTSTIYGGITMNSFRCALRKKYARKMENVVMVWNVRAVIFGRKSHTSQLMCGIMEIFGSLCSFSDCVLSILIIKWESVNSLFIESIFSHNFFKARLLLAGKIWCLK